MWLEEVGLPPRAGLALLQGLCLGVPGPACFILHSHGLPLGLGWGHAQCQVFYQVALPSQSGLCAHTAFPTVTPHWAMGTFSCR